MEYLKLFEAYSSEDYQRAIGKIKNMLANNKSKEEVIAFINKYYNDDAKQLDQLRILFNRIQKQYALLANYWTYNYKEKIRKNRKTGEEETYYTNTKVIKFFGMNVDSTKDYEMFIESQKTQFDYIISNISADVDLKIIKFVFNKIYETCKWFNKTGVKKNVAVFVNFPEGNTNEDRLNRLLKIYTDVDFDDDLDELKKLTKIAQKYVLKEANK